MVTEKQRYLFTLIVKDEDDVLDEITYQSIIKQSIGFQNNIELLTYKDNEPFDFTACRGEYISFINTSGELSKNCLKKVYSFFKKNKETIDFVVIPTFAKKKDKTFIENNNKPSYDTIIDTANTLCFPSIPAITFYKKEALLSKNHKFMRNRSHLLAINNELLLDNSQYGFVCEGNVKFSARFLEWQKSTFNNGSDFFQLLSYVKENQEANIANNNYIDELFVTLVMGLLNDYSDESKELLTHCKELVRHIDIDYILYNAQCFASVKQRYTFINFGQLPLNSSHMEYIKNNMTITVRSVEVRDNGIIMDISYENYGNDEMKVVSLSKNGLIRPIFTKQFDGPFNLRYGHFMMGTSNVARFIFDIDSIDKIEFSYVDTSSEKLYDCGKLKLGLKTQFNSVTRVVRYDSCIINYKRKIFYVSKNKKEENWFSFFIYKAKKFRRVYKKKKYLAWTRFFEKREKPYILINDRPTKGGDNGEALFRHIYKSDTSISKKTYYVIKKESQDYKRLKSVGKTVALGSLKHKFLFINSKIIYTTHLLPEYYNAFGEELTVNYNDILDFKIAWIQHGITMNDVSGSVNPMLKRNDFTIASTKKERDEFLKDKYCIFDNQVLLTGLPRFDLLDHEETNTIVIAPTWRRTLKRKSEEDYKNSDFFQNIASILSNETILERCRNKHYKIKFLLHPEMAEYTNCYQAFDNDIVTILPSEKVSYNKLFKEAKLWITDYSSTFFDFTYLKKPIILFQFDKDEFFRYQYNEGYFDYQNDGFGDVLVNSNHVIKKIEYYFDNDFVMEKKYLDRVNDTFMYTDQNCCSRILKQTLSREGKK